MCSNTDGVEPITEWGQGREKTDRGKHLTEEIITSQALRGETETIWKGKSANQQVRGEDDNINSVLVMQFQKLEKQGVKNDDLRVKNNDLNSLKGIPWQSCG